MRVPNKSQNPVIEIVAGPNGSGKSTFAESYLIRAKKSTRYLNPDLIASGFGPGGADQASFQAGRILIQEIKDRIGKSESFAFESTLSGKTWLPLLLKAQKKGYSICIYFLFLNSVQKNIARIKKRVQMGGHHIPTDTVKRRHPRCFENFWTLYRPLCESWHVFDNSDSDPKELCNRDIFAQWSPEKRTSFAALLLKGKIK